MKQIMKEYMFDRLKNQQGAIFLPVVIALTSLLGAAVYYDVPGAVDEYAASLTRMRDGESTIEDLNAFHDAFDACANAAGGLPIPSDANDVIAIGLNQMTGYSIAIGIADTPAPPPAGTSLSSGCSMTLSSTSVKPGDTITATLTTPALLHSKIGNISCEAEVVGFSIPVPEGTSPVSIPDTTGDTLTVKCYVVAAAGGDTICSPAVTVSVDHTFYDGTCSARGLPGPEIVNWKGRQWQRCDSGIAYKLADADTYCENLDLGGHTDWRMPTKNELKDLVVCTNGTTTPLMDQPQINGIYQHPNSCSDGNIAPYDQPTIDARFADTINVPGGGVSNRYYSSTPAVSAYGLPCRWWVLYLHGASSYSDLDSLGTYNHMRVRCTR